MDIKKIKELALANGFKLKEQASGNMDLNAYVYDFANAVEQAAKAQAVPEGFVLVNAEQLNQWGHMANAAEQYGCCDCFESRGYAHNLACEINSYFEPIEAQEQSND